SLVIRSKLLKRIDFDQIERKGVLGADRYLELSLSLFGPLFFIDECMGVHIKHKGGITSFANYKDIEVRRINYLKLFLAVKKVATDNNKSREIFYPKLATSNIALFIFYIKRYRMFKALGHLFSALNYTMSAPKLFIQQRVLR